MRRGSRSLAAMLATMLVAGPALAEPRPSDKDRAAAGELVKKAIARSQQGDHDQAIVIYLQAYTIVPNSALLSNVGAEYEQSGKPREALKYFCMYLDRDPEGANAPYATTQARLLQKQLGNKNVDDDNLCAPPRAEPKPVPVEEPAPPPRRRPVEPAPEPVVVHDGSPAMRYAGVAVGVAGLAALGIGAYEGVQAKNVSDQISNHKVGERWPNDIRDIEARGQRDEDLEIVFLIGGGALLATGAILYALGRPSGATEHGLDKAALHVAPTRHGFAVLGRF